MADKKFEYTRVADLLIKMAQGKLSRSNYKQIMNTFDDQDFQENSDDEAETNGSIENVEITKKNQRVLIQNLPMCP